MFGNIGFTEIMMLMVVFLLVFGAKRLPEIGASMGKGIREFKRSMSEVKEEIDRPVPPPEPKRLRGGEPGDRDTIG